MTPQMIQSMEMLQLPLMELEQKIQQELLENPALELADFSADGDFSSDSDGDSDEQDYSDSNSSIEDSNDSLRKIDEIDCDWDNYYDEVAPRRVGSADSDEEYDPIESAVEKAPTLQQHLEEQLSDMDINERERRIATNIIYNLDPSGYLKVPLSETIDPDEDPIPEEMELETALEIVQSLDPAGIGAQSVEECLLIQIDKFGRERVFERMLVEKHLEDLAANRFPQIARATGSNMNQIKAAAAFIRTLNPHPGLEFGSGEASYVQPDVRVEVDEDGNWTVSLIGGTQPDISDSFLALFDSTKRGKQLREEMQADPERAPQFKQMQELLKNSEHGKMMREKFQSAKWLITAIAQRERTLLRVANDIVDAQKSFLSGQTSAPAPLMMQQVADNVGIDISTVSRAVRDKYMICPIGLVSLRDLFTRAVGGSDNSGNINSNVHIMNRLKEIIDGESKAKPLKDDELMKMLSAEGIEIKRRTVAKYRANLGFPSHSQRREY